MNIPTHPLQIGTLAVWMSVSIAAVAGILLHPEQPAIAGPKDEAVTLPLKDLVIGTESPSDKDSESSPAEPTAPTEEIQVTQDLPAPPEIPVTEDFPPLPEIPDVPARPAVADNATPEPPPVATPGPKTSSQAPASRNKPAGRASLSGTRGSGGTGMSASARLAAGIMPAPSYPLEARRKGQTGTVLIEFTVDTTGVVISAYAKSPSPWPLLNDEAVRTVRRWKFPPGGVMKLQRPIVFKLR